MTKTNAMPLTTCPNSGTIPLGMAGKQRRAIRDGSLLVAEEAILIKWRAGWRKKILSVQCQLNHTASTFLEYCVRSSFSYRCLITQAMLTAGRAARRRVFKVSGMQVAVFHVLEAETAKVGITIRWLC